MAVPRHSKHGLALSLSHTVPTRALIHQTPTKVLLSPGLGVGQPEVAPFLTAGFKARAVWSNRITQGGGRMDASSSKVDLKTAGDKGSRVTAVRLPASPLSASVSQAVLHPSEPQSPW